MVCTSSTKWEDFLAGIHFPVTFAMVAKVKQAIARVVAFATAGADQVTAPLAAVLIVTVGYSKGGAATAGDQEHAEWGFGGCTRGASWLGRSLTTPERRLRSG